MIETDPEIREMMALTATFFKTVIINMLKGMKEKHENNENNKRYEKYLMEFLKLKNKMSKMKNSLDQLNI